MVLMGNYALAFLNKEKEVAKQLLKTLKFHTETTGKSNTGMR